MDVDAYISGLPEDRRQEFETVRNVVLEHLPEGYEERFGGSMILYVVPNTRYHCNPKQPLMYAGLAAQKNYHSLHLLAMYMDEEATAWFKGEHEKRGKKLKMGKGCVNFVKAADLDLELIGQAIARVPMETYLARYEAMLASRAKKK
jgi:hypothetical protein